MNLPASIAAEGAPVDADASTAVTIQFRRDQKNSGVSRHGVLHPGGRLKIEYDASRLGAEGGATSTLTAVICHMRFQPSGEQQSGTLLPQAGWSVNAQSGAPRPLACEVQIPERTSQLEVWFEGRAQTETTGWDSRYGQNYTFPVADDGLPIPERSVLLRADAVVDTGRIRVVQDSASKDQIALGHGGTRLRTSLAVRARIGEPTGSTLVWADVHVFDATGELINAGSIAIENPEPSTSDELRFWDAEIYPGSGGASGMGVSSRPDAHTVHYRLYCRIADQLFTDGVLHQFEVPADTDVRRIPGGW